MKFSEKYIDAIFEDESFERLSNLLSLIVGSDDFSRDQASYGLEPDLFAFVAYMNFFCQTMRSGSCTYFQAEPPAIIAQLDAQVPHLDARLADNFRIGIRSVQDELSLRAVDEWVVDHEDDLVEWLVDWTTANRSRIVDLIQR